MLCREEWEYADVGQHIANFPLYSFCLSSRSLGRFTLGYDQAQFNPHLFSGDAASRGASGVVGSYSPYLQGASLKVPGLEGYQSGVVGTSSYGTPSTLQQALLSPTPLDYRPPQQHVTPTLQGLLSPRHSLTGHADPRLPPQDLAALLKRQSPRPCQAPPTPPSGAPQEYGEMLLLRQLSQGESLEPPTPQGASGGQHYHHLLQIRPPEVQPQQHPAQAPCTSLPHSESMEEDEVPTGYHHPHEGLLAKAGEGHELLGPPRGGTPPYSSPTHRHGGYIRSAPATRGKACLRSCYKTDSLESRVCSGWLKYLPSPLCCWPTFKKSQTLRLAPQQGLFFLTFLGKLITQYNQYNNITYLFCQNLSMWSAGPQGKPWRCLIITVWAIHEVHRVTPIGPVDSYSATTPSRPVTMPMWVKPLC